MQLRKDESWVCLVCGDSDLPVSLVFLFDFAYD